MDLGGNRDTTTTGDSILVVCTGNVCRSPLAQVLLHDAVARTSRNLSVLSAGTGALLGGTPPIEILTQASNWGFDLSSHEPSQLNDEQIRDSTLVITAERSHRAAIVGMVPNASRKVFTLKQLARVSQSLLAEGDPTTLEVLRERSFAAIVDEIADHRALTPPPSNPEEDDVPDPYLRSQQAYDLSAAQIREAIESIRALLQATDPI